MSGGYRYFVDPTCDRIVWRVKGDIVEFNGQLGYWVRSCCFDSLNDLLRTVGDLVEVPPRAFAGVVW